MARASGKNNKLTGEGGEGGRGDSVPLYIYEVRPKSIRSAFIFSHQSARLASAQCVQI